MATIEQPSATDTIDVENPATGQVIRSLPVTPPEEVAGLVARARAAQPAWEALGFEGRARVLRRMQKWMVDNAERVIQTIVDESGKTYEDAAVVELAYGAGALGFWAKRAPKYLADEKVRTSNPFVLGRKLVVRYRPVGVVGVIGPWNYPLTNNFGDAIPALAAGNAVVLKPSQVTPLTSLLLAEGIRECGLPEDAIQVADRRRRRRAALIDEVDFVMFTGSTATGKKVMARAAETLTPVGARARRQGPDDRARRRRPRARRQRRHLLLDAERRPDLRLGRARLRRGADLRPLRRRRHRARQGAAPGPAGRAGQRRGRRDHVRAAARHRARPRRAGARRPARGSPPAGTCARAPAASSSRPCSPTSTTR